MLLSFLLLFTFFFFSHQDFETEPWRSGFGIFVDNWFAKYMDADEIDEMVGNIRGLGMNTIIITYAAQDRTYDDDCSLYYPSTLSFTQRYRRFTSLIENILTSAQSRGIEVYVGLYADGIHDKDDNDDDIPPVDERWFEKGEDDSSNCENDFNCVSDDYLERQASRSIQVFDEAYAYFFPTFADTIKGWYLPHELALYYWEQASDRERLADLFINPVKTHIHSEDSSQKLLISGYNNMDEWDVADEEDFWDDMFALWTPDVLVMMDGLGSGGDHMDLLNLGTWLEAVKRSCDSAGVELWSNVELFQRSNINDHDFLTIQGSIEICTDYAERVVVFDYSVLQKEYDIFSTSDEDCDDDDLDEGEEDACLDPYNPYYYDLENYYNCNYGLLMSLNLRRMDNAGPYADRDISSRCALRECMIAARQRQNEDDDDNTRRETVTRNAAENLFFMIRNKEFPFFTVGKDILVDVHRDLPDDPVFLEQVDAVSHFSLGIFGMFEYKKESAGEGIPILFDPMADSINKWYYFGMGLNELDVEGSEKVVFDDVFRSTLMIDGKPFFRFRLLPKLADVKPEFPKFDLSAWVASTSFMELPNGNLSRMVIDENSLKFSMNITDCRCNLTDSDGVGIALIITTSDGIGQRPPPPLPEDFDPEDFVEYPNKPSNTNIVYDSLGDVSAGGYLGFKRQVGISGNGAYHTVIPDLKHTSAGSVSDTLLRLNTITLDKLGIRDRNMMVLWMTIPRCDLDNIFWDPTIGFDMEVEVTLDGGGDDDDDTHSDIEDDSAFSSFSYPSFLLV